MTCFHCIFSSKIDYNVRPKLKITLFPLTRPTLSKSFRSKFVLLKILYFRFVSPKDRYFRITEHIFVVKKKKPTYLPTAKIVGQVRGNRNIFNCGLSMFVSQIQFILFFKFSSYCFPNSTYFVSQSQPFCFPKSDFLFPKFSNFVSQSQPFCFSQSTFFVSQIQQFLFPKFSIFCFPKISLFVSQIQHFFVFQNKHFLLVNSAYFVFPNSAYFVFPNSAFFVSQIQHFLFSQIQHILLS